MNEPPLQPPPGRVRGRGKAMSFGPTAAPSSPPRRAPSLGIIWKEHFVSACLQWKLFRYSEKAA